MYYCTDCGEITEGTTETETVLESIPGIQRGASQEIVKCSNCGSYDIEEAGVCRVCGDYIQEGSVNLCDECYSGIMAGYMRMLQGLKAERDISTDEALYAMSDVFEKFYEWKL